MGGFVNTTRLQKSEPQGALRIQLLQKARQPRRNKDFRFPNSKDIYAAPFMKRQSRAQEERQFNKEVADGCPFECSCRCELPLRSGLTNQFQRRKSRSYMMVQATQYLHNCFGGWLLGTSLEPSSNIASATHYMH